MKDEEMSCEELYYAYDLTENQQRKWLIKISRHWLKKSINLKLNKVVIETLDVVEKYIKGQATEEELKKASAAAYAAAYAAYAARSAAYAAYASTTAAYDATAYAAASAASAAYAATVYAVAARSADGYKELLLEVINEMDEFERIIRRKM